MSAYSIVTNSYSQFSLLYIPVYTLMQNTCMLNHYLLATRIALSAVITSLYRVNEFLQSDNAICERMSFLHIKACIQRYKAYY